MKPSKRLTVPAAVLSLLTACGPDSGSPEQAPLEGPPRSQPRAVQALPTTCADIRAAHPGAADGAYVLYAAGEASLPWTVYCHDMAGTPAEYLSLRVQGGTANFSTYAAGGASPGTSVRTAYSRLRIDPATLRVNTADQTFAVSTGSLTHSPEEVTAMPWGVAMSCNHEPALANIDLRNTPFAVAGEPFSIGGVDAQGSTVYSEDHQVVNLSGGGRCGWAAPVDSYNPFNQTGTWLPLRYRSSVLPASCVDLQSTQPSPEDGLYTLYVQRDPLKPWTAWCQDMAGAPTEYLPLVYTGTSNYSQYTAGGNSPGTSVRTTFTRLRVNPTTLRVNTADQRFSSSTGELRHGQEVVKSMPYAAAMGCSRVGVGNVDLRGTPFAVQTGAFARGGMSSESSSFSYSAGNQVVGLAGYGGCGWMAPTGSYNPFNQNGVPLTLVYTGQP
jgi:hypothetical protein